MSDPSQIICGKLIEKFVDGTTATVSQIISQHKAQQKRADCVKSNLEKLNARRNRIESVLSDAVQRRRVKDDAVKRRLRELRSIAFDIEDLYDVFHTQENVINSSSRKRKWHDEAFNFTIKLQFADQIDEINERYENIKQDRNSLELTEAEAPGWILKKKSGHLLKPLASKNSCSIGL